MLIPAYCRTARVTGQSSGEGSDCCHSDRGTHWNFRCSEELQESLQRSQRRRLHVNPLLLQFDGAQGLFEFPDKLILKPSTTHSTGSIPQPLLHWFCPLFYVYFQAFFAFYLQDRDLILLVGHEQREPCQRLLQVFPQNLYTLRSCHLLVLFVLVLHRHIHRSIIVAERVNYLSSGNKSAYFDHFTLTRSSFRGGGNSKPLICVTIGPSTPGTMMVSPSRRRPLIRMTSIVVPIPGRALT